MKLYRTRTQEQYDWLMQKLEDEGCFWASGRKPTELDYSKQHDVVSVGRFMAKEIWREEFKKGATDQPIIEVSDLMDTVDHDTLMQKVVERNNKPEKLNTGDPWIDNLPESYFEMYEEEDAIRPQHYRKGEIDLYESWYRTYPFNEFRAGMQMIAERYMRRDKNDRIEDLEKARYTLERLKEYEVQHERD